MRFSFLQPRCDYSTLEGSREDAGHGAINAAVRNRFEQFGRYGFKRRGERLRMLNYSSQISGGKTCKNVDIELKVGTRERRG